MRWPYIAIDLSGCPVATVFDAKQLVVVAAFSLAFLLTTILVAYLTRSGLAVAAVMGGLALPLVALGLVHARLQHAETSVVLGQPDPAASARQRERSGHS